MQEAVAGVGAALQAVEAAQGLFQTLERNLLAKVICALSRYFHTHTQMS